MLLNELCAALEDLGNCEAEKDSLITQHSLLVRVCSFVCAECCKVRKRNACVFEVCTQRDEGKASEKETLNQERVIDSFRSYVFLSGVWSEV